MRQILLFCTLGLFFSCAEKTPTAQEVIDRAIETACSGNCEQAQIEFDFRGRHYLSKRDGGSYRYERQFKDSLGLIKDVLTNDGYSRFINDSLVMVVDSMATKYANSVNSVHYFVQLPFGLNAPAVHKEFIGETAINGQPYFEIGISFTQKGGGTDFEDEFVYWIHKKNYTVDYLAYSYTTDGGGIRFRKAFNPRIMEGIRIVDYDNLKPASLDIRLEDLDLLFQKGELELLSKIITENASVTLAGN